MSSEAASAASEGFSEDDDDTVDDDTVDDFADCGSGSDIPSSIHLVRFLMS